MALYQTTPNLKLFACFLILLQCTLMVDEKVMEVRKLSRSSQVYEDNIMIKTTSMDKNKIRKAWTKRSWVKRKYHMYCTMPTGVLSLSHMDDLIREINLMVLNMGIKTWKREREHKARNCNYNPVKSVKA